IYPLPPNGLPQCRGSRHQYRHQVGKRRSRDEEPACLSREVEHRARPLDDLAFNFDRDVIAAAEIGVEPGSEHLRQHADRGATAVHPSHEAWMDVAGRVRRDEIGELPVDIAEIGRLSRKLGAKAYANLVRYRTPYRTFADVGDVIDHVIEHAMTLRTKLVPALRIQRLARSGLWGCFVRFFGHP